MKKLHTAAIVVIVVMQTGMFAATLIAGEWREALGMVSAWLTPVAIYLWWIQRKKRPNVGPFRFVRAVSERRSINMKFDIIKLKVGLPASAAGDIVRRELMINRAETAGGELEGAEVINTRMMELEFEAVQDSEVTLSCVAFDNATPTPNESEPKEITFTVRDTIAPELTGEFSIEAIGERTVGEDPAPSEDDSSVASPADEAEAEPTAETGDDAEEQPPTDTPTDVPADSPPGDETPGD